MAHSTSVSSSHLALVDSVGRTSGRPILLTSDGALVADVQRLAVAAGTGIDVVPAWAGAAGSWITAPLVLVGADLLHAVAAAGPPRRDRVHVIARSALPDGLFPAALRVAAESVVELPAGDAWLVETLADAAEGSTGEGVVVGVVGGCGGAGSTTFATALAIHAADTGHPATLVDADRRGAGVERVLGMDDAPAGWGPLLESSGRLGARSLRSALSLRGDLAVLGWGSEMRAPVTPPVMREALSAASRGSRLVVVDLPRYVDDVTAEAMQRCDEVIVVCPLDVGAVAAAARVVSDVVPLVSQPHLVARRRGAGVEAEAVADLLGLTLVAVMSDQRRLEESVELGLGPLAGRRGPLARAVRDAMSVVLPSHRERRR